MIKLSFFALLISLSSNPILAATNFLCSGKHQEQSVVVKGVVGHIMNPKTAYGTIFVDGIEVASFEGPDAKINYMTLSFKARNFRGELVEGKATDLASYSGVMTRLYVPGFGIDIKNVSMTCAEISISSLELN